MKLLLVINVADDVAEAYEDFTVDFDLRGTPKDNQEVNESIKYVEGCPLKPMPKRVLHEYEQVDDEYGYVEGWNACLDEMTGETE